VSRSRRKTPIFANANSGSEAQDKKTWHRRWRRNERTTLTTLAGASSEKLEGHLPLSYRQVSNPWSMSKDGKTRLSKKDMAEVAEIYATRLKGQNQDERAQAKLKVRCLRRLLSK